MKTILAKHLADRLKLPESEVIKVLEQPKESQFGDLAFPCFALSKSLKQSPHQIAATLSERLAKDLPIGFEKAEPLKGYLNFFFDGRYWTKTVLSHIQQMQLQIGDQPEIGREKTVVFDYSSPNLAKPMSIGHLRSSVIGQALVNIHKAMGYKTIGINYLGDWGVQFGKLAWAHLNRSELLKHAKKLGDQVIKKGFEPNLWKKLVADIETERKISFDYLYALYVVFHACSEIEPTLDEFGREYFVRLEKRHLDKTRKDPLNEIIEKTWQEFVDVSLVEGKTVYDLLGIHHDLVRGESFHEPDLEKVVDDLKKKNLLVASQGAEIVDLEPYGMPPCLIKKSDGATLYATRDIAAAIYRHDVLKADKLIYVVGAEQTLHFKQFFKVLELMGYRWAESCVHVPFGLYRFKEGKMSTRRGNVVFLEDVLFRAIDLVKQIISEKNPDLTNADDVSKSVGTGAVVFNDLMNDRQKNIDFDWDKILDFNGDTGPYVQYSHVRCCSIMSKWGKPVPKTDHLTLNTREESEILRILGSFEDAVRLSYEQLKPNWIAHYLLGLSKAFNGFYYAHRILEGDSEIQESRVVLTDSVRLVLKKGLSLLGIRAPEQM